MLFVRERKKEKRGKRSKRKRGGEREEGEFDM